MKVAIDSYSYHRYFGEWYEGLQNDIGRHKSVWEFLEEAKQHQVQGVSLESCFLEKVINSNPFLESKFFSEFAIDDEDPIIR